MKIARLLLMMCVLVSLGAPALSRPLRLTVKGDRATLSDGRGVLVLRFRDSYWQFENERTVLPCGFEVEIGRWPVEVLHHGKEYGNFVLPPSRPVDEIRHLNPVLSNVVTVGDRVLALLSWWPSISPRVVREQYVVALNVRALTLRVLAKLPSVVAGDDDRATLPALFVVDGRVLVFRSLACGFYVLRQDGKLAPTRTKLDSGFYPVRQIGRRWLLLYKEDHGRTLWLFDFRSQRLSRLPQFYDESTIDRADDRSFLYQRGVEPAVYRVTLPGGRQQRLLNHPAFYRWWHGMLVALEPTDGPRHLIVYDGMIGKRLAGWPLSH